MSLNKAQYLELIDKAEDFRTAGKIFDILVGCFIAVCVCFFCAYSVAAYVGQL